MSEPPHPQSPEPETQAPSERPTVSRDGLLSRELRGDLPCIVCGYNLRGLSIRSMCPECGAGVRATILSVVDPRASELRPIPHPRLVATGLILWSAGATVAGLLAWLPHIAELLELARVPVPRPNIALGVQLGMTVSMIGSLALIRPHAGVPRLYSVVAAIGTLLYSAVIWSHWRHSQAAAWGCAPGMFVVNRSATSREMDWFVLMAGLIGLIIACELPMARVLVARSLVLRTGRVDRQTMLAMAAACGLMVAGGLFVGRSGGHGGLADLSTIVGAIVITFGAVLLTIGLFGSLADCLRIAQSIIFPRPTLRQVIRHGDPASKSRVQRILDRRLASDPPTPGTPPPTTPGGRP